MAQTERLEVGLMFWGEKEPERTLRAVQSLGMRCGHLGFAGHVSLDGTVTNQWKAASDELNFGIAAVFAAFEGESYADVAAVQATVGYVPQATRELRESRSKAVIDAAAAVGSPIFACHIGYIPEDHEHPDFVAVRDMVQRVCDRAARHDILFALETGQETAEALLHFMAYVDRPNLKVNFDPANMILYGTAEPIPALETLASHVVSVHCKDGVWPPEDRPGSLGTEMPLGEGAVGMDRFVETLKSIGYTGPLVIEREVSLDQDMDDRHKEGVSHQEDIRSAVRLLERLRGRA